MISNRKSYPALRFVFVINGGAFVATGIFFGVWVIVLLGALCLFGGGLETCVEANPNRNQLVVRSRSWGIGYYTRTLDVAEGSSIVGILYPAGTQTGGEISLCDDAQLFFEDATGRRSRLVTSSKPAMLFNDGEALANTLKIAYKNENKG